MKITSMMSVSVALFSLTRIRSGAIKSSITIRNSNTRRAAFQMGNHCNYHSNSKNESTIEQRSSSALNSSRSPSSMTSSSSSLSSLPESHPYLAEIKQSLFAIRKACRITTLLQPTTKNNNISGMNKKDASPVTIGDFAVQALVLNLLEKEQKKQTKNDVFIAEEKSDNLIPDSTSDDDQDLSNEILDVMKQCGYNGIINSVHELKRSIDLGQTYEPNGELKEHLITNHNGSSGNENDTSSTLRAWCLDPIDGTRGFLRGKREGGQYCIALALIEDGIPVLGVLGCPNLPVSATDTNYAWSGEETHENNSKTRGCIIVASKNGGCYQIPLHPPTEDGASDDDNDSSTIGCERIYVTQNDGNGPRPMSQARFCIGVESYSDADGKMSSIAKEFHGALDADGEILYAARMDSQVKYGVLARGSAEIYARLPKKSYVEWIWDHAPGRIVIEEAGGVQTDTNGNLIDYGLGAKMDAAVDGIIASPGGIFHEALVNCVKE